MKARWIAVAVACVALVIGYVAVGVDATEQSKGIVLFNITSDGEKDPHPVTMALQLANHALDADREVVLFFNVKGGKVPTKAFPADLAFSEKPIATLVANLAEKGADIHVCPHCMKAMGIEAEDLIPAAKVTNRDLLFAKIGPNTAVFTY